MSLNSLKILKSVQGKTLTEEVRVEKTIQLAAQILSEANSGMSRQEKTFQSELAALMRDPIGRVFTTELTDQSFRSQDNKRAASQIYYLLKKYGIPKSFRGLKYWGMRCIQFLGPQLSYCTMPFVRQAIRKETKKVILAGEERALKQHLVERQNEGVSVNLNHLGEAILGEEEAERRLQTYLTDLDRPEVECISVKISTLYSQINLLAWEETLDHLAVRFRKLLKKASQRQFQRSSGVQHPKIVNLDMEEYRDLHLTKALFKKVLEEPEFLTVSAGIALQSYIPDSYLALEDLSNWALERVEKGGAPIKIRLVKGANLAMEKVEAALKVWPQAPYETKIEVDENYKKMLDYALDKKRLEAVRIGVGSHNLFDLSYALILATERNVCAFVTIEMLEGMAEFLRRKVQPLAEEMLLYCPAATAQEFQNAVAYLLRRLDENSGPENFLRHSFGLVPDSGVWQDQAGRFAYACLHKDSAAVEPRRRQDRGHAPVDLDPLAPFENEPDTDWSLQANLNWLEELLSKRSAATFIPAVIAGKEFSGKAQSIGHKSYLIPVLTASEIEAAINCAQECASQKVTMQQVASMLRKERGKLIVAMMEDTCKTVTEADAEVSEAIDFAEYYPRSLQELQELEDLNFKPKGAVFIASPWNFSCSIPAGGIIAALVAGNRVIFKPAPEAIQVGYELAKAFWAAGVSKEDLQFIPCDDETAGKFVKDERIKTIVVTGATDTARMLLKMRPGMDLLAETGGKNSIIVTAMADRDLAVRDVIQSAFGYSGQKCSACSVLILEEEVFNDPVFKKQLKDAAESLKVGEVWDLSTKINPLIRSPEHALLRAIDYLEKGEEWLLKPQLDSEAGILLTPGIKWGVRQGSFTHVTELFGPVLAVMKAKDLNHAISIANSTQYGLTAGLHSLDEREHAKWLKEIQVGNCYINRGITGAIVGRQPFGGIKKSSFGLGAKAGGPNYLFQFVNFTQKKMPEERASLPDTINELLIKLKNSDLSAEEVDLIEISARSYSFFWKHFFSRNHDMMRLLGQDNIQSYFPLEDLQVRIQKEDSLFDVIKIAIGAKISEAKVCISLDQGTKIPFDLGFGAQLIYESEEAFIERISRRDYTKIRLLRMPGNYLVGKLSELGCWVKPMPVIANGRIELLQFVRELSISYDYHRYGYLGAREQEKRKI